MEDPVLKCRADSMLIFAFLNKCAERKSADEVRVSGFDPCWRKASSGFQLVTYFYIKKSKNK